MSLPAAEPPADAPARPHRDFLSVLMHQLRTPLAALQGTNYLLNRKLPKVAPELRDDFQRVLGLQAMALTALKEMIDQVHALHRINRAVDTVVRTPTPVGPLVEGIVTELNRAMPIPRLKLESALASGFTAPVSTALLEAAIRQLLSNGLKFSPETAEVRVVLSEVGADWLLSVADRGVGIPPGEQARVFEHFFRASNVGKVPGSGLGLVIAQRVAGIHGGRVEFSSTPGNGATFVMLLPKIDRAVAAGAA